MSKGAQSYHPPPYANATGVLSKRRKLQLYRVNLSVFTVHLAETL